MRYLRSHPRLSWLARVLALVMLAPYLLWAKPASAQRSIPSVYVLDFNNKTTIGGQLLGRVAAAQVSLQLSESQNWDVVPDAQVQRRIQELNLKPPFDRVNRVQIANGIDANAAIYGTITDARVTTGAAPQAFVRMQVLVEDVQTAVLINGAIVEGLSTPRMGYNGDADVLLEEALGKAAFKAREFMDRFRLPEGTVLNTTVVGTPEQPQLDALINIGARQGVRRGMTMIVTRQREPVGTLRVTSVDSDISTGRVVNNVQGVKPEDRVRAIFNFSDFPVTRARLKASEPSLGTPVAANTLVSEPEGPAAAPKPSAIIAATKRTDTFVQLKTPHESHNQLVQNAVQAPPPVVVDEPEVEGSVDGAHSSHRRILGAGPLRTLVGGLLVFGILAVMSRGGINAARPYGVTARGFQITPGASGAFIQVKWDRPKSVRASQVLGYVIWRSDPINFTPIIVGGLTTDSMREFLDNESTRDVNAYNGTPGTTTAGTVTAITNVPGIIPGTEYRYQISTAYTNQLGTTNDMGGTDGSGGSGSTSGTGTGTGTTGTGGTFTDVMSALSESSGWATAIEPPTITNIDGNPTTADQQVDLRTITVEWQQTPGANTYLVWLSTDPTFPSSNRVVFGPFATLPSDQGGPSTISRTLPNANKPELRKRRIYISVGGRNSQDALAPIPFGAIFSPPVQVRPEQGPPGPPGQSARTSGGNRGSNGHGGKSRGGGRNGGAQGQND